MDKVHTLVGKLRKREKLVKASDAIDDKVVLNESERKIVLIRRDATLLVEL